MSALAGLTVLSVRRWGEEAGESTPIVLDGRVACGSYSEHLRRGCIGLRLVKGGASSLVHLTTADALRLSDLLRAMAEADQPPAPTGGEQR